MTMQKKKIVGLFLVFTMLFTMVAQASATAPNSNYGRILSQDNQLQTGGLTEDFEEVTGNWDMEGGLANRVSISEEEIEEDKTNRYLRLQASEVRNSTATKTFEELPRMLSATVSFRYYIHSMTTESWGGFGGIQLLDNGKELVSFFINDLRTDEATTPLRYAADWNKENIVPNIPIQRNKWYTFQIEFDFIEHTALIYIDHELVDEIAINEEADKINQFAFAVSSPDNRKMYPDIGVDDLMIEWIVDDSPGELESNIYELKSLPTVDITKEDWEAGYEHPTTVEAVLVGGDTVVVEIDTTTWTSEPEFDVNKKGWYKWTADIIETEENANPRGLKATYIMAYRGPEKETSHDYFNDFTFDIWESIPQGSEINQWSPKGGMGLSHAQDNDGNYYMRAEASANRADRGSRLYLEDNLALLGSTVKFDWMPIALSGGYGEIMFFAPANWNSYFTLRFDTEYNILAYTECSLGGGNATDQIPFEGSISMDDPIVTGLKGNNKWYTIELEFDYVNHMADFTIYDKKNPDNRFSQENIPIEKEANGLSVMLLRMAHAGGSCNVVMGIDNLAVDFHYLTSNDIAAVLQPDNVSVARSWFNDFEFPTSVTVELGDGSRTTVEVGEWVSNPEFDPDVESNYTWTAQLITGELNNPFNLYAQFEMEYTLIPYVTYVNNPATLELEFGEPLPDEMPDKVVVFLSGGLKTYAEIDEWIPIREFNENEEGIYIWGANIKENPEEFTIPEDLSPNEYHDDPEFSYHAYYRVNYFSTNNNYNAYRRAMEYLDRGVYAIQTQKGIFVSWRLLATEYGKNIKFNIYRNGTLVNEEPITDKTNYIDVDGKAGDSYTVETILDGKRYLSDPYEATSENYLSIPLQNPGPQKTLSGEWSDYTPNDAGVADVDGDGQYEILVRWSGAGYDPGSPTRNWAPSIYDVYRLDGTPLWRLNLGYEMPNSAHMNNFMFYDLDSDGKAELFIKTSDGAVTYRPNDDGVFDMTDESTIVSYIGDPDVVPGSGIEGNGMAGPNSNEYVTVFNGLTGEEIDTVEFANPVEDFNIWGDNYGNRASRYNIAIAYLPKYPDDVNSTETIPAVLINRGYYNRTTVAAYTLRDGKINLEWNFIAPGGSEGAGKGNHNMATGDIDNDGFDELVMGSIAIDHDGTILWIKDGKEGRDNTGHGDAIHLAAMSPYSNQLYSFSPLEGHYDTVNFALTNASNGGRIGGQWLMPMDTGRGIAANITPLPGFEFWAQRPNSEIPGKSPSSAIYNFFGDVIATNKPTEFPANWRIYWDGDLLSELPDSTPASSPEGTMSIYKYNWEENTLETIEILEGSKNINWTKNNPNLSADILGDWREEIIIRSEDNSELRIYMTDYETDYMIYTLMHDPVYRNAVANQNSSYNQPPHLGFYLGEDIANKVLNMELPVYNITYTSEPDDPGVPVEPEEPEVPEDPEDPEEPEIPEDPADSEVPEDPEEPEAPEDPAESEVPEDPEEPEVPEDPAEHEDPEVPEDPQDPEESKDSGHSKETVSEEKPKTGDINLIVYILLAVSSISIILYMLLRKKLIRV